MISDDLEADPMELLNPREEMIAWAWLRYGRAAIDFGPDYWRSREMIAAAGKLRTPADVVRFYLRFAYSGPMRDRWHRFSREARREARDRYSSESLNTLERVDLRCRLFTALMNPAHPYGR